MKSLTIENKQFLSLEVSFKSWLDALGYAEVTVVALPVHVREMLHYFETQGIRNIRQVREQHVEDFAEYVKIRKSPKTGTSVSVSSINKILTAVRLFIRYLREYKGIHIDASPRGMEIECEERIILTRREIKALYDASYTEYRTNSIAMGQRDRAMLAIFYGCGLRRTEGQKLDVADIDLSKGLVFVRRGKGNKQRYVPIASRCLDDIKAYLTEGRDWFLSSHTQYSHQAKGHKKNAKHEDAFFVSQQGRRMYQFYRRLAWLKENSGVEKTIGLHTFRHSIATHLLESGMKIEDIARFLGHKSLESTQIYTHITEI